ncbi:MAG: hypothetical protein U1D30_02745 [Planctomycetota bacterium]
MSTDHQLQQLYRDLAEAHRGMGQGAKAADSYALALYYARRIGDVEQVRDCRQKISDCNPSHIVCRESTAPLFFAQLLMRNPPDEAEQTLRSLQASRSTPKPSPSATSTLDIDPFAYARIDPMDGVTEIPFDFPPLEKTPAPEPTLEWQGEPSKPALSPKTAGTEGLDNHHLFSFAKSENPLPRDPAPLEDLFGLRSAAATMQATPMAVDDYIFEESSPNADAEQRETYSFASSLIQGASILTLIVGTACVTFFGYELYPTMKNLDVPRLLARFEKAVLKPKNEPASMNAGDAETAASAVNAVTDDGYELPAPNPVSHSTVRSRDNRANGSTTR